MATVFSANKSSVLLDGEPIEGLQSIVYRIVTEREDIRAIGSIERVDVNFGLRTVHGEVTVRSSNKKMDEHIDKQTSFQLVAQLKKSEAQDAPKKTVSFDDCFVEAKEYSMDAGGTGITIYKFTATRVREE